jgi:hypothetical protein
VPYALIAALASSVLSSQPLLHAAAALQLAFYGMAASANVAPALNNNRLVSFARVFVELNWIALQAGVQFWRGRLDGSWEKT